MKALLLAIAVVGALAACSGSPSKEEIEAAKNTIACQLSGERLVIRYAPGEARLLMPEGNRVTLYQIAMASGMRYSNGLMELRGKGVDLQFIREGVSIQLVGCAPYTPPPK